MQSGTHCGKAGKATTPEEVCLDIFTSHFAQKRRAGSPALRKLHCRGTCGPDGAAGPAGAGCGVVPPPSWLSTPPVPGAAGTAGAPGAAGVLPPSRIERGLRSKLARIDRNRLVAKNSAARIPVARVSTLAVPRFDMKAAAAAPTHAEPTALGLLDEDQAHHGEHDHQMDQDNDSLHERSAQKAAPGRRARSAIPHMGIRGGFYTIPPRTSTPAVVCLNFRRKPPIAGS